MLPVWECPCFINLGFRVVAGLLLVAVVTLSPVFLTWPFLPGAPEKKWLEYSCISGVLGKFTVLKVKNHLIFIFLVNLDLHVSARLQTRRTHTRFFLRPHRDWPPWWLPHACLVTVACRCCFQAFKTCRSLSSSCPVCTAPPGRLGITGCVCSPAAPAPPLLSPGHITTPAHPPPACPSGVGIPLFAALKRVNHLFTWSLYVQCLPVPFGQVWVLFLQMADNSCPTT